MSLKLNEPRNIRGVISYKRSFGDLNEKHLKVAQTIGIRPLASREEAEKLKEKLQHIATNDLYAVDSLTHSIPYLIPGAAAYHTRFALLCQFSAPPAGRLLLCARLTPCFTKNASEALWDLPED